MTDSQFKECHVWSEGGGREEISFIFQKIIILVTVTAVLHVASSNKSRTTWKAGTLIRKCCLTNGLTLVFRHGANIAQAQAILSKCSFSLWYCHNILGNYLPLTSHRIHLTGMATVPLLPTICNHVRLHVPNNRDDLDDQNNFHLQLSQPIFAAHAVCTIKIFVQINSNRVTGAMAMINTDLHASARTLL